jgi:hypothetical protein
VLLLLARCNHLLASIILGAALAGCTVAYKTSLLRKDVLTDAQQAIANTQINHGDMTIIGSVDREDRIYDTGQPITLSVKVSKDAHVAILRVLPSGDTTIVFPNRPHPKADIAANAALTVPGPDDAVKIVVDKPGVVLFEFIASSAGESWLFTRPPDKDSDFADLGITTRAIAKDLLSTLKVGKGPETVASYLTIRVGGGLF